VAAAISSAKYRRRGVHGKSRDQGLFIKEYKETPPTIAANNLDITIEDGEFLVLLGPRGCGKTSTLRCLAGLEAPDRGQIQIGDKTVTDVARGIGMEFQSYALWPHMTLRDQVRNQLHQLHRHLEFTAVFVTHDQSEALSLADRIAVLNKGSVEQLDTAQHALEEPATEYAAAFMEMTERLVMQRGQSGWALASGATL